MGTKFIKTVLVSIIALLIVQPGMGWYGLVIACLTKLRLILIGLSLVQRFLLLILDVVLERAVVGGINICPILHHWDVKASMLFSIGPFHIFLIF